MEIGGEIIDHTPLYESPGIMHRSDLVSKLCSVFKIEDHWITRKSDDVHSACAVYGVVIGNLQTIVQKIGEAIEWASYEDDCG